MSALAMPRSLGIGAVHGDFGGPKSVPKEKNCQAPMSFCSSAGFTQ
jgi:hypothetical protein